MLCLVFLGLSSERTLGSLFCSAAVSWWSPAFSPVILHLKTPFHPGPFRRKETSRNSQRDCRANAALSLPRLGPALLQAFPTGSETLSGLLCKWGSEVFSSPAWLSLEDSQSLLKLCVFSGAASKVPGVRLPSVLYIKRIFCVVYLMCLSQR